MTSALKWAWRMARIGRRPAAVLATTLLAAGAVAWAAVPMSGARSGAKPVLVVAICCAAVGTARLVTIIRAQRPGARQTEAERYLPAAARTLMELWSRISLAPWAQSTTIAVLALEALHGSRPWHTAALGVVVLGYLLALHLTESRAGPRRLRPQVPLLIAGAGLACLSAGAAVLEGTGSGAGWVSVLAAVAAVVVAALALPV